MISFKVFALNTLILLLAPLLLPQGIWVKSRTLRLPEPQGKRSRKEAAKNNTQQNVSVLIAGDSAAAGVGVGTQHQALSGQCERHLSLHYNVSWHLSAQTGLKSEALLERIALLRMPSIDVAVISIGVNDVTGFTSVSRWRRHIELIIQQLLNNHHCKLIVFTALPPMHKFPALPQPLRWILGQRALLLNQVMCSQATKYSQVKVLSVPLNPNESAHNVMAKDGFHPGEKGYQLWGKAVATLVGEELDRLVGNSARQS